MNNIKVAKQLVRIAKSLIALDDEYDGAGIWHDPGAMREKYEQEELDEAEKQGKKYILHHKENGLWRIMACKDFATDGPWSVSKGEFGGLIESEKNLSHDGECWIYVNNNQYGDNCPHGGSVVYGNAKVYGDAWISNDSTVCDNAQVYGNAWINKHSLVCDNAKVYGNASVQEYSAVYGNAKVYGNASVQDHAQVCDGAQVYGNAKIHGMMAQVSGKVYGDANIKYCIEDWEEVDGKKRNGEEVEWSE